MDRLLEHIGEGAQRVQNAMEQAGAQFLSESAGLGKTLLSKGENAAADMKNMGDALAQKMHDFAVNLTSRDEHK